MTDAQVLRDLGAIGIRCNLTTTGLAALVGTCFHTLRLVLATGVMPTRGVVGARIRAFVALNRGARCRVDLRVPPEGA